MNRLLISISVCVLIAVPSATAQTAVQGCTPAPEGIWAWWPFDEVPGEEAPDLLGGNPARYIQRDDYSPGRVAGALRFDGIGDYLDVSGDRVNPGYGDFSMALWIRTTKDNGGVSTVVDKRDIGSTVRGFSFWLYNGRPGLQLADGTGPPSCSNDPLRSGCTNYGTNVPIANGDWHFVAITVDRHSRDGGRFYVDGVMVQAFDPTIRKRSVAATAPLRIGAHSGTTPQGHFTGSLDELQFFRRALDAGEVDAIYRAGTAGVCKNVAPAVFASASDDQLPYVPGVVIIKLEAAPAAELRKALQNGIAFALLPFPPEVRELNRRFGASAIQPLFRSNPPITEGGLDRFFKLTIDKGLDAAGAAFTYGRAKGVDTADPDWIMRSIGGTSTSAPPFWNLGKINAASAWKTAIGTNVVVAVIDTGVLLTHPDLKASIWTNLNETPDDKVDDDDPKGSGYIDDLHGWNFVNGNNDPTDLNGHGTHVAGTIVAANDGTGVTGVAYGAKVLAIRALDQAGKGATSTLAIAIEYAILKGVQVINNSWGGAERSPAIDTIIGHARSRGIVVVSAAGNDKADACRWTPGNAEGGITVSATGTSDTKIVSSNFGAKLDVGAPGEAIRSTWLNNGYGPSEGTSMAAPHVSALAALLIQAHSKDPWTPEQIRQTIRLSAFDVGTTGFDLQTGFGRIDLTRALSLSSPPPVAAIDGPTNCRTVAGNAVQVFGSASADKFAKYELWIAQGADPTPGDFKLLSTGSKSVSDGILGSFDSRLQTDDIHTLRLVTKTQDGKMQGEDRNIIKIDNMRKAGWPTNVSGGSSKSPMVADLDGDGTKEIILGMAVFDKDGKPRPGWTAAAGFGRSNPAVVDLEGDGPLEVIAADWPLLNPLDDEGIAEKTGPKIYAFNANNTLDKQGAYDWVYSVQNTASPGGYHHGIPSSISVADVDGDGLPEVVFTVYFDIDNADGETEVFILSGKKPVQKKTSFRVAGRAISSVALVPHPAATGRLLVISTDTHLHVVDAKGQPYGNGWWPKAHQVRNGGLIDPIVADVDGDKKPEILFGPTVWTLNGTLKHSLGTEGATAAVGQLTPTCGLEMVLSGGKDKPYSARNDIGTDLFSVNDMSEEQVFTLTDENGQPGAPLIADLDGDGSPEIIGPSRRGSGGQIARLYAWHSSPAGKRVAGFPRLVPTSTGVILSSAAIDDIDNDGQADLLVASDGQLHAWNLKGRFEPSNNPWPMFQHDLAHTGYLPSSSTALFDLWVDDTPRSSASALDNGGEPSGKMTGQPVWLSRALWVRSAAGSPKGNDLDHQNPLPNSQNRVYVSVHNRGCRTSAKGQVELLAAKSSLGPPAKWSSLGIADVASITPGGSVVVNVPWTPTAPGPYAFLARIASEPLAHGQAGSIESSVRKNNNLAWRNVQLVTKPKETIPLDVVNPTSATATVDLKFTMRGAFVESGGGLQVDLGWLWDAAPASSNNVTRVQGGKIAVLKFPATVKTTPMARGAKEISLIFDTASLKKGQYILDVTASIGGVPIGGASYVINR
ncbi:MAG TPA: S8 family serine peptidase [Thermoanaerobaculia bacterium]|nr:S8 family serine peptidase [Thermoanaerobaculia bacterium]